MVFAVGWRSLIFWAIGLLSSGADALGDLLRREISSAGEISPHPEKRKPNFHSVQTCEDWISTYECKGTKGYDQSCIFHCAYLTLEGDSWVITLLVENASEKEIVISDWDMPAIQVEKPVTVKVKSFQSKEALRDYARDGTVSHHRGLSVLFRALWQDRWAHAVFDGLYPAYVSLSRFGLGNHSFTPVALLSNYTAGLDCRTEDSQLMGLSGAGIFTGTACQMEEAIRLFGAGKESAAPLLRINDLQDELRGSAILFDHLVSGSGHLGEYASVLALPGTLEGHNLEDSIPRMDLLGDFADRMYLAHGIQPPHHVEKPKRPKLKVLITSNKRMSPEEVADLTELAESASAQGASSPYEIRFVDWSKVQPFKAQLELLRETDIMVSGIGTALFYSAFLPWASVCVNTGWKDDASVPTYGEDILSMSNHRTRFLYMPLEKVRRGVTRWDIENEIHKAAALIAEGKVPPKHLDDNLSIFGRIIRELSLDSEASRRGLQGKSQEDGGFLCHQRPTGQTSLSDVVFERALNAKNLMFQVEQTTLVQACQIDVHLLRELKRKYNLTNALGAGFPTCDCVACEACGFKSS